ncbi:MAG: hypothetical protein MUF64_10310 [Polyangiaceae bacterium]|jgi:glutathione synthase/RimK-type ligase-like ATP-grasp enzyme|nr:hypothetical protein [Polyangiaceae bacterium]
MTKTVALLTGRERTFPDALIQTIQRRGAGVDAGYASLDITPVDAPPPYAVIVDRISHDVPCYQPVLKCMALRGSHVINNPFWRIADDKAFGTALAARLGVPIPRTFVLPSKEYGEDITPASLHNLKFPLDWGSLPFPLYIKPHWGGGFRDVYRVESLEALWRTYDRTGRLTMIAQESIEWEQYIRCVVIGQDNVLPLLWDPRLPHHERYLGAASTMPALDPALRDRVVEHARTLCHALGYDMNTCEFAVRDGVPYAIDFMNSAPDFEGKFLGEETFSWIVDQMATLCIRLAGTPPRTTLRWDAMLSGPTAP